MLGKALHDNVIIEPQFSGVFLNVLLGRLNQIDDIWYLDETLHHNLMSLKKGNAQKIADLGLKFEIQSYHFGESITKDLIPNGSTTIVTKENIHSYIHRYANYKLNVEVSEQSRAFMSGFRSIVPVSWIQMFSPKELQLLISGDPKPIDIEDMRKHVSYGMVIMILNLTLTYFGKWYLKCRFKNRANYYFLLLHVLDYRY
jgi:hypothetical protein